MTQSLEQYVAEATNAYQPSTRAVQSQIDALSKQLDTTNQQINRNYAQQQAGLNRQRNQAAETASMQAAGSGGSFGGSANIANRKYYEQSFVPAVTQLQTNQTNDLASARQANDDRRTSLEAQLANIQAQANQQALQQYYADQEAERNRELQRQQIASQNAYNKYLMDAWNAQQNAANTQAQSGNKAWDFGNGFSLIQGNDGRAYYTKNGKQISAGDFLIGTSATRRNGAYANLWNDIWNNGVNTYGIGGDTVNAFNNGQARGLSNYNDLFRM